MRSRLTGSFAAPELQNLGRTARQLRAPTQSPNLINKTEHVLPPRAAVVGTANPRTSVIALGRGPQPVARCAVMDAKRIAAFPAFANLPAEELNELAGAMTEVEIGAGATVIHVDDYGTAIYLIEAGTADVLNDGGDAITALGPGDTCGEIGLLLTGQRTATVVASTPMRLLSLSGQDFDGIRPRVPEVERSLRRLGLKRAGQ